MPGKNDSNNKNSMFPRNLKIFGSIPGKTFFNRVKTAAAACICATLLLAVSLNIPRAYAMWFNDNAAVSEVGVDVDAKSGVVETEVAAIEPSGFGNFVTAFSGSKLEYVVYVDGVEAGTVDSIDVLNDILDEFIARYSTERTVYTAIEQDISTKCVYTESPVLFSADRLKKALDPNNTESECHLTVSTVETYDASYVVPYETVYVDDPQLYVDTEETVTEGVDGFVAQTVSDTFVNGKLVESTVVSSETVTEAVDEVIAKGTKPLTASNGYYIWPTDGILTSDFGPRSVSIGSSYHKGIDIVGQYAQDIWAADGGEVIYAGWAEGYGNIIKIQHDNGDITCYAHCCELLVFEGERVYQGQVIAHMGDTGTASAVHVHFEIRIDNMQVDPLIYLP